MFRAERVHELLSALGDELLTADERAELVVCGGAALIALGLITRATADVDVVAVMADGKPTNAHPLPQPVVQARDRVGRALHLPIEWLNDGPASQLTTGLPEGWLDRLVTREYGPLTVHFLGRLDQIHLKLYALVDQGPTSRHESDLRALQPSRDELLRAARWTRMQDPSDGFHQDLVSALVLLGVADAFDVV